MGNPEDAAPGNSPDAYLSLWASGVDNGTKLRFPDTGLRILPLGKGIKESNVFKQGSSAGKAYKMLVFLSYIKPYLKPA